MTSRRDLILRTALLLPALPLLPRPALAQTGGRPDGPVTLVVPFTPSTAQDLLARLLAPALQEGLGQPVIVENRAGASGQIGTQTVARATPDGRTLMIQGVPFVMSPPLLPHLPYDPARDFTPIIQLAEGHVMLLVRPDLEAATLLDFVGLARARPGALDYASPGNGTAQHMAMELFKLTANIDLNHIPYRGTAPAVQDLLGRRVAAMMLPVAVALPLVRNGQARALAIGAPRRSPEAPEVPTLAEAGFPMRGLTLWYGLFGPANLPAPLLEHINAAANAWLADPGTQKALQAQSLQPAGGTPARFRAIVEEELREWARVVKEAGITPG
ncbi:tripartite tricarboxylate transporter substrate binding protein [Pseudoroseomonas ludipueritiae]|uniref:Tripartite tricarboxylate transporter substrate binding protein n=1 Tax=Pseudoroseomonas ludipueritiae TaxID=198093 RepID=A0ABR7R2A6_9PROT|nr:tripartite tricarboxylate transporter substrate binding protein [Pseudoroseomonas ludipueritiae]MBC9175829.1 tripartite tricarboxylate transporter substrate binding protein [Pseudoroseomonas ludipueritiae]